MPDIRERFSALDHIDIPDLRALIEGRDAQEFRFETARQPSKARRTLIASIALAVALAAFLVLTDAFRHGTTPRIAGHPPAAIEPPQPPRWVVEQALSTAASFGDPEPSSAEWILTTGSNIARFSHNHLPGSGRLAYLVVMHGLFTDPFKIGVPPSAIVALSLDRGTREVRVTSRFPLELDLGGLRPLVLHPTPVTVVTSTIMISHFGSEFYPPPTGAGPRLTADQAIARFQTADPSFRLPSDAEVFLGKYSGSLVVDDRLAYGIRFHYCQSSQAISVDPFTLRSPSPSNFCTFWLFLNADTGKMLEGLTQTG
jgi:hypothetical protein